MPTISNETATGCRVSFGTTDPDGDTLTYKVAVTTSPTPPADWSGYTDVTSPHDVTGLTPETTYYAHVRASDGSLTTVGTSAPFATSEQPTGDTTAPTLSGTLTATASIGQIVLDWSDATDNVAVTGYDIEYGTTASYGTATTSTTSTKTITGLAADTLYYFRVRAYDAEGNKSDWLTTTGTIILAVVANFTDNFNRADSTDVGNGWAQAVSNVTGAYGILGQVLITHNATMGSTFGISRATTVGNRRQLSATVKNVGSQWRLVLGRRGTTSHNLIAAGYGYVVTCNGSKYLAIFRVDNGVATSLGTYYKSAGFLDGDVIVVNRYQDASGDWRINAYVNGVLRVNVIDDTYMTDADGAVYGFGAILESAAGQICTMDNIAIGDLS